MIGDEDQYREVYRMALLRFPQQSTELEVASLAKFVVDMQRDLVRTDSQESLERLEHTLIKGFEKYSGRRTHISEDEFVESMLQVDRRAPLNHYNKFLERTFQSYQVSGMLPFETYVWVLKESLKIPVDEEMKLGLHEKLGDYVDLQTFLKLSGINE